MQSKTITLILLGALLLPFVAKAEEGFGQELGSPILDELESVNSANAKSDAEILQSLDSLNAQLNNELFVAEQQGNDKSVVPKKEVVIQNENQLSVKGELVQTDEMLLNDSFDDLKLDDMIGVDETTHEPILLESEEIKMTPTQAKKNPFAAGAGESEVLINTLDNSDLMDFEENIDLWDNVEDIK